MAEISVNNNPNLATTNPSTITVIPDITHASSVRSAAKKTLKDIGAEAANEWSSRAFSVGVDLGFQLEAAPVYGQPILLQELLSNLIHNAIEHAGRCT